MHYFLLNGHLCSLLCNVYGGSHVKRAEAVPGAETCKISKPGAPQSNLVIGGYTGIQGLVMYSNDHPIVQCNDLITHHAKILRTFTIQIDERKRKAL